VSRVALRAALRVPTAALGGNRAIGDRLQTLRCVQCDNFPVLRPTRSAGAARMPIQATDLAEQLSIEGFGAATDLRELLPSVYGDLKRIAHVQLFRRVPGASLSTTVLVHETWMKLARQNAAPALSRAHFIALCARVMRQILIDRLRARAAEKRGGGEAILSMDDSSAVEPAQIEAQLGFAEGLGALAKVDARLARLIEQHWFIGLDADELAELHGVGLRTIQRELKRARAWIGELLAP